MTTLRLRPLPRADVNPCCLGSTNGYQGSSLSNQAIGEGGTDGDSEGTGPSGSESNDGGSHCLIHAALPHSWTGGRPVLYLVG
jgi:hypothetical protein